jgi:hypothetical protein
MGPSLQIGQTCCYWSKGADKPLPALVVDCEGDTAVLAVFSPTGGRFIKTCNQKIDRQAEGWTEVGQIIH